MKSARDVMVRENPGRNDEYNGEYNGEYNANIIY
jgi:hypothetical protein